ncbi:MAG: DUF1800 family protein [Phycisphaerales bacterium]|nr:DUF1800 family protein [Phycisphaerales bacterium]
MRNTRLSLRWSRRLLALAGGCSLLALPAGCPSDSGAAGDGSADGGGGNVLGNVLGGGGGSLLNRAPSASIVVSPGITAAPGETISLDAASSSDPDGDALTFAWTQLSGPEASLSGIDGAGVYAVMPYVLENAELHFSVLVQDGRGGQASAEATVFVVAPGGEFSGHAQATLPYRDKLSYDEAYHLLRRAQFGARPDEVNRAVERGLAATVDDLLVVKPVPDWVWALDLEYQNDVDKRWLLHLIESPNGLQERLAMFWHDRFATSARVIEDWRDRNLGVLHREMLRFYALGNYREFLEALTLDPLMLIWLDGANSPKQNPNENYAREFWELFTLGRDTLYTEADIREGARAFTGITLLRQQNVNTRPIYDLTNHDETVKTIFPGRAAPANYSYEGVIDLTLAQPEAPRYVARNLFAFFVHDHPSDETVQELADQFVASNFEIAPLVRTILMSQALFSSEARYNQISSPVEHVVGVARTLDMHVYSEDSQGYLFDQLAGDLAGAGMELLNPPGVEGWHEGAAWLQDQWIISRVRALGRTMEFGPNFLDDVPYHLLPPVETWANREARDQIVSNMASVFHLPLTQAEHDIYVEVLDQGGWLALHLANATDRPRHVREMIRLMAMDERVIGR